jgi:hypothetical protein
VAYVSWNGVPCLTLECFGRAVVGVGYLVLPIALLTGRGGILLETQLRTGVKDLS